MKNNITTWKQFARKVRSKGCFLLSRLDDFPCSILVTGVQRSGTTMLSRIITNSAGMVNYWFGIDDELDAALILSGYVKYEYKGRYCFQTTYLNECYEEYFTKIGNHKIIWVLRNPHSVVYSMVNNWPRFALNELYVGCAINQENRTNPLKKQIYLSTSTKFKKACLAYKSKLNQLFDISENIKDNLIAINYESLVQNSNEVLKRVYNFIDIKYNHEYSSHIHNKSINLHNNFSKRKKAFIDKVCQPVYLKAKSLCIA